MEGTKSNKGAVGARVKIVAQKADSQLFTIYRHVSTGSSFGGNSLQLEVGLGDATSVKSIEVIWPNKEQTKSVFENIEINKFYKLKEGSPQLEDLKLTQLNF